MRQILRQKGTKKKKKKNRTRLKDSAFSDYLPRYFFSSPGGYVRLCVRGGGGGENFLRDRRAE